MTLRAAVKRLYREDRQADEDWTTICSRVPVERPVDVEACSTREALEKEYLAATLRPHTFYAVEKEVQGMGGQGQPEVKTETVYFELLAALEAKHRERTMHTVEVADDLLKTSGFVLHVVFHDRWPPDGREDDDSTLYVFPEADDEWVVPARICEFDRMANHMVEFGTATHDPTQEGCLVLADPKRLCRGSH